MKYYIILVISYSDDTNNKKSVYEYNNKTEMMASFYSNMSNGIRSQNLNKMFCIAMDENGMIYKQEVFVNTND